MSRYNFRETEAKWQRQWRERGCFEARADPARPKYYVLDMFPYKYDGASKVGHLLKNWYRLSPTHTPTGVSCSKDGVFVKKFVEIAEAEEKKGVRVAGFNGLVLLHQGCGGVRHSLPLIRGLFRRG